MEVRWRWHTAPFVVLNHLGLKQQQKRDHSRKVSEEILQKLKFLTLLVQNKHWKLAVQDTIKSYGQALPRCATVAWAPHRISKIHLMPQLSNWNTSDVLRPLWVHLPPKTDHLLTSFPGMFLGVTVPFQLMVFWGFLNFFPEGPTVVTGSPPWCNRWLVLTKGHAQAWASAGHFTFQITGSATPCSSIPASFPMTSFLADLHWAATLQQRTYAHAIQGQESPQGCGSSMLETSNKSSMH